MSAIKIELESWWLDGLYLSKSKIQGEGIFTSKPIAEKSVIFRWGGVIFTEDEIKQGKARAHTYVGIGEGKYLANPADKPPSLDDFVNHSCDSNIWMADEVTLVARRSIHAGEEITADYALWLNRPEYIMKQSCNCGSTDCRKVITGVDWKLRNVQERYLGHFSPFINKLINQ